MTDFELGAVCVIDSVILEGMALEPNSLDLIALKGRLDVGEPIPNGWRVMTGNSLHSLVVAVAYREEIEAALAAQQ